MFKIIGIAVVLVIIGGVALLLDDTPQDVSTVAPQSTTETDSADATMETGDAEEVTQVPVSEATSTTEASPETETDAGADAVKEFTLDSFNFGYSETEIRVQEGDTVTINLTNSDGFHDWVVDEFDAATDKIRAGETTSVTFVADAAGTYEYYCSVGNHRQQGMVGTLVVE